MNMETFSSKLDQIQYNYWLEICALIFLCIFAAKFFVKRKFPNILNAVFGITIVCAIFDLGLDIIASILCNNINNYPPLLTEIVNGFFYSFQSLFPALCALYVFLLSGKSLKKEKWHIFLFIPAVIFFFLQCFNPLHHWLFEVKMIKGSLTYTHTDLFFVYYIMCALYILLSVVYTIIFRKNFAVRQRVSIYILVSTILLSIILQIFIPNILLTGTAITISIYIAMETFADPNHMIDKVSGVFNLGALLFFFKDYRTKFKYKYCLCLKIDKLSNLNQTFSLMTTNEVYRQIGIHLKSFSNKAWEFRIYNSRFFIVFKSEVERQRAAYFTEIRFRSPWEIKGHTINLAVQMIKYTITDMNTSIENVLETCEYVFDNPQIHNNQTIIDLDNQTVNRALRINQITLAIEYALANNGVGFSMRYQPIYNVKKNRFTYCEALLRFEDPELGKIGPDEFIPIAEAAGLAPQIDQMVLENVCKFSKLVPSISHFSINVSGAEFFDDPSTSFIQICKKYDVNPRKMCFEVTETSAISHVENIKSFISSLEKEGFSFAIDDFGTGYSNLAQMMNLSISKIKFDKSLLQQPELLKSLFIMMKSLNMKIVMEGVETEEQYKLVVDCGTDYVQGYFFSMPLEEKEFISFIEKNNKE